MTVQVTASQSGLRIIEGRPDLWERKRLVTANGIAKIRPNMPFVVKVANFSGEEATLQRNERIASALPVPIPAGLEGSPDSLIAADTEVRAHGPRDPQIR